MAIKINNQDLQARYINGNSIGKVMLNGGQIRPETIPPVFDDYLRFGSMRQWAWHSFKLEFPEWQPHTVVSLEYSSDKVTWTDYTIWNWIDTWAIWEKVYIRSKSETPTTFNGPRYRDPYYRFQVWSGISVWGDVTSLLCKYWASALPSACFVNLFNRCVIESMPHLTATDLWERCYMWLFSDSYIRLSDTQDTVYQYEFRVPITWIWIAGSYPTAWMFSGGYPTSPISTPDINTTYYATVPTY